MVSYSRVVVLNKDLKSGLVKTKTSPKKQKEYWIYRIKDNAKSKLYLPDGYETLKQNKENSFLFCLVIEESIEKKTEEGLLVIGFKLTGDSINEYLKKTNRHVD